MHSEGVGQLSFAVLLATKIYLHSVIRTEGHITMLNGSALPPVVREQTRWRARNSACNIVYAFL